MRRLPSTDASPTGRWPPCSSGSFASLWPGAIGCPRGGYSSRRCRASRCSRRGRWSVPPVCPRASPGLLRSSSSPSAPWPPKRRPCRRIRLSEIEAPQRRLRSSKGRGAWRWWTSGICPFGAVSTSSISAASPIARSRSFRGGIWISASQKRCCGSARRTRSCCTRRPGRRSKAARSAPSPATRSRFRWPACPTCKSIFVSPDRWISRPGTFTSCCDAMSATPRHAGK